MLPEEFTTWTVDEQNKYLRHSLAEDLVITFTKVDGSTRVMPCTLRTDAMPQQAVNEHHQTRIHKPESIRVWCLDKAEWRSFRVSNVIDIQKLST